MGRLACVNIMELPLQLLLRRRPDWLAYPTVVVDEDSPTGVVRWANRKARRRRIAEGMRYAQALSLARELRAGTVAEAEVEESVEALAVRLQEYSPIVEASGRDPGIFWLDAAGLEGVFGSLGAWAKGVVEGLRERDAFYATVVVGFGRFATWMIAGARRGGAVVLGSVDQQEQMLEAVPVGRMPVSSELSGVLKRLGVTTLGEFLALPAEGVHRRFGGAARRVHEMGRGVLEIPLTPYYQESARGERVEFEAPEGVSTRLLFAIKRYLHPLIDELEAGGEKIAGLEVVFDTVDGRRERVWVRPAAPTVDEGQLLDLVRLKLESMRMEAGVGALEVVAHTAQGAHEQMALFASGGRRDLEAANQALARVRAEMGEEAVVCAKLRAGHLPEARFRWEPLGELRDAQVSEASRRSLIREFRHRARPASRAYDPDVARLRRLDGPFVISGGWWVGGIHRRYHFAQTEEGEIVWLYFDAVRERWMEVGRV